MDSIIVGTYKGIYTSSPRVIYVQIDGEDINRRCKTCISAFATNARVVLVKVGKEYIVIGTIIL